MLQPIASASIKAKSGYLVKGWTGYITNKMVQKQNDRCIVCREKKSHRAVEVQLWYSGGDDSAKLRSEMVVGVYAALSRNCSVSHVVEVEVVGG